MSVTIISPTLTLPLKNESNNKYDAYKLNVAIAANDNTGVVIDNVLPGDFIYIYRASGIASFKKANMKVVKSIVGIANTIVGGVVIASTDGAATPFVKAWNKSLKTLSDAVTKDEINRARRDPYGQDPSTSDYAKKEGGLILCMPKARGAIYANNDYYLQSDSKSEGRKYKYYSKKAKENNVIFPCPVNISSHDIYHPNQASSNSGRMSAIAEEPGAIQLLAFDSKFTDNAGTYEVGLVIVRKNKSFQKMTEMLIEV